MSGQDRSLLQPASPGSEPSRASAATSKGSQAYQAAANNTGSSLQTKTNGPALTVSASTSLTPAVSGTLFASGCLSVTGTSGNAVTFTLSIGGTTIDTQVVTIDATNLAASAKLEGTLTGLPLGTPAILLVSATAAANLTTTNSKSNIAGWELA